MNRELPRPISREEIEAFQQQGVAFLPSLFDQDWITLLLRGVDYNMSHPGPIGRDYERDSAGHRFFYDTVNWRSVPEYQLFVYESPIVEIAAILMEVSKVNFFFETIFCRTAGTKKRTPWHQDEPYWPVQGMDTCSIWMPLAPVERNSALEFVPKSHRWPQRYRRPNFGQMNPDGGGTVFQVEDAEELDFPDIESDRESYDIVAWDMEPGDCVAFNARIIHGGSGTLSADRELKVFNTQWLGDDVVFKYRENGMDPDITDDMLAAGLKPNDPIDCELFPKLWPRSPSTRQV